MEFIDIEKIKAENWSKIYSEIQEIINFANKKNEFISLPSNNLVCGIRLDEYDMILLYRSIDDYDIAEEFEDQTFIDVYNSLFHMLQKE